MTDLALIVDSETAVHVATAVHVGRHRGGFKHLALKLAAGAPVNAFTFPVRVLGWDVLSTDGVTAAVVTLINGADVNGEILGFATPALGLSTDRKFDVPGLLAESGVTVSATGGACTVVLYYLPIV